MNLEVPKRAVADSPDAEGYVQLDNGGWYKRDRGRPSHALVKCPVCDGPKYKRLPTRKQEFRSFTARCSKHRSKWANAENKRVPLPDGGWYQHDPRHHSRGLVKCPDCFAARDEIIPHGKDLESFSGRCDAHRKKKRTGTVLHDSGAWCYFDERDPKDPAQRCAFLCANYGRDTNCLGKTFTYFHILNHPKWHGHCENCVAAWRRQFRKIEEDVYLSDAPGGGTGTRIAFSQATGSKVPVTYWKCRDTVWLARSSVTSLLGAHRRGEKPWKSRCRACFENPDDYAARLAELARDGQKNGGVEKQVDAKLRRRYEWLLEAVTHIANTWKRVREYDHLSRDKQIGLITLPLLADKCDLGDRKAPGTAAKQMSNRLDTCGVKDMFPGSRRWYESFRETVVEKVESGKTAEEIVSSLQSLRTSSRSAA